MSDRDPQSSVSAPRRGLSGLARRLVQARLSLAWENAWPALWPAAGILGTFAALALLDVFAWLPGWLHALVLVAAAGIFGYALYYGVRRLGWPSRTDALRRIETASGMEHRPLEALQDRLSDGVDDPLTRALWAAHQRQMADRIRALKVGAPSPGLPARDPWAVRAAVVLLLVIGAVVAGRDSGDRLARAFVPQFGAAAPVQTAKLEIWLKPPDYTRLPPIFPIQIAQDRARAAASKGDGATSSAPAEIPEIEVPDGSVLTAIVSGGDGEAVMEFADENIPFEKLDAVNRRLEATIDRSGRLTVVHDGETLGSWSIRSKPDAPPKIAFDDAPAATERGTLRLGYSGSDDYGITEIRGEMRRTYERGEVIGKEVSGFELPAPSVNAREVKESTFHEIAPHPWAGLPVVIRLAARDAAGQVAYSEEIKMILPEREFTHPVAKRIIEERRRLTTQPERRPRVIENLNALAAEPGAYKDDTVVFMGLVFARSRLFHDKDDSAIPPVRDLLWDTALRVEDGRLSHAERDLVRAQEALMKALARDASDQELERLMRELQSAMDRYMQELARKLQEAPQSEQAMPLDPTTRIMRSADFQRMLEQIRDMMRSGSRDAARQMLSQLRNMLEALRNARIMRGNPQDQQGNQAFRQLQDMIQRQNRLMDQTFRQSQGPPQQGQMQQGAAQQRQLREMLQKFQQMMQGMMPGDSPAMRSLNQAGQAMEDAAGSLGQGQPGEAVGSQGQALEALQRAGRGMMQQMMQGFARGSGIGMDRQFNPMRSMRDPLGREWQGDNGTDTRRVTIPDEGAIERAQEILQELRKRAGQRHRPQLELDYIERLLRRF